MRARNLKPGFFLNDELAEGGPAAQILYEGLWCLADREGKLEDKPKRIQAQIFPYYDPKQFGDRDISGLLDFLAKKNFIVKYEVEGSNYIKILTFLDHQRPHTNEVASTIPEPLATKERSACNQGDKLDKPKIQALRSDSLNPDSLNPDSLNPEESTLSIDQPIDCPRPNGFKISDLAAIWNEKAPPELARVSVPFKRSPKKLKPLIAMVSFYPDRTWWEGLISKIHCSSFLRGKNDRGWKATFDFVVGKADEINDGKYIDAGGANKVEQGISTAFSWAKNREARRDETT